jgi:hypothetical protein
MPSCSSAGNAVKGIPHLPLTSHPSPFFFLSLINK